MYRWLSSTCRKYGERTLIRPSFRYNDLLGLSELYREEYRRTGVGRGSRVVVSDYNSPDFLGRVQALWGLGATPCLISKKHGREKRMAYERMMVEGDGKDLMNTQDALILLTTGTSSQNPKGVRLTHQNLLSHVDMLREHIPLTMFGPSDRTFSFLPWTHCYGLMGECFSVMDRGASMGILSSSAQAEFGFARFFQDLQRTQPTILFVVPYVLEMILQRDVHLRKLITNKRMRRMFWFGSNLRFVVCGGAYLRPEIRRGFFDFLDVEVLQGYGCTEMSPMISLQKRFDPMDVSVGETIPDVQVDIRNEEIWVNGGNRFYGYVGESPLSYAEFYNTRDRGYVRDGRLYVNGRSSNMVKLSNGKFVDVQGMEKELKNVIPYCQDVCLWWNPEKGRFYGVAHVVNRVAHSASQQTFEALGQSVNIHLQRTSFVSIANGTLTSKGEKCRPLIQSLYEHHLHPSKTRI